jgi:hypothetical protein
MVEGRLTHLVEARGLSFLWVKTQLYSYALHDGMLPPSARTEFVLRGFESAFHYIEAFSTILSTTPLSLLPALYPFSAMCSWVFVFKTLYSRYRMYLDFAATEQALLDAQKVITSKSQSRGDFCWRAGIYMENLLQDAKNKENNLGEPFLGVRSRMAAGLYFDGLNRLTDLSTSRDTSFSSFETKVSFASPISAPLSSLTSSPFLSSDDLSTPPTSQLPAPAFAMEKPIFTDFWTENPAVDTAYAPDTTKLDMEWLADSFLTGEGGVAPSDLSNYVAPGLLMVQ